MHWPFVFKNATSYLAEVGVYHKKNLSYGQVCYGILINRKKKKNEENIGAEYNSVSKDLNFHAVYQEASWSQPLKLAYYRHCLYDL